MTTFTNLLLRPGTLSFFENFVKSVTFCLSKLKVTPSFCFAFKIPNDPTTTNIIYIGILNKIVENVESSEFLDNSDVELQMILYEY